MKKCFWKKDGQVITPAASHFFVSRGGTRGSIRAAPSANNSWTHCWLCVTRLFFPSVWYTVFPELLQSELALWVIAHTIVNLHCRQHFWGVLIWSGEAASTSLHQVSYGILIFGGFSFTWAVPRAVQDSLCTGKERAAVLRGHSAATGQSKGSCCLWEPSAEGLFPAVSSFPAALPVFSTDLDMPFPGSSATCFPNIWAYQGVLRRPVSPFILQQAPPVEMHFLVPTVPLSPCLWLTHYTHAGKCPLHHAWFWAGGED